MTPPPARPPERPVPPRTTRPPRSTPPPPRPPQTTFRKTVTPHQSRTDRFVDGRLVRTTVLRRVADPAGPRMSDRYRLDRFDQRPGLDRRHGEAFLRGDLRLAAGWRPYSHHTRGTRRDGAGFVQWHPAERTPPRWALDRALGQGRWPRGFGYRRP